MSVAGPTRLGEDCRCEECGHAVLTWYAKPATQAHLALVIQCHVCEHRYPTRYLNRRHDTRDEALAAAAREVVREC
jgi:hypothetical protein